MKKLLRKTKRFFHTLMHPGQLRLNYTCLKCDKKQTVYVKALFGSYAIGGHLCRKCKGGMTCRFDGVHDPNIIYDPPKGGGRWFKV